MQYTSTAALCRLNHGVCPDNHVSDAPCYGPGGASFGILLVASICSGLLAWVSGIDMP